MARDTTLLELVTAVAAVARSDADIVRIVIDLVRSGEFRLCGTFRGVTFRGATFRGGTSAGDDVSPERLR
jgi:hypothetical protein